MKDLASTFLTHSQLLLLRRGTYRVPVEGGHCGKSTRLKRKLNILAVTLKKIYVLSSKMAEKRVYGI